MYAKCRVILVDMAVAMVSVAGFVVWLKLL